MADATTHLGNVPVLDDEPDVTVLSNALKAADDLFEQTLAGARLYGYANIGGAF